MNLIADIGDKPDLREELKNIDKSIDLYVTEIDKNEKDSRQYYKKAKNTVLITFGLCMLEWLALVITNGEDLGVGKAINVVTNILLPVTLFGRVQHFFAFLDEKEIIDRTNYLLKNDLEKLQEEKFSLTLDYVK